MRIARRSTARDPRDDCRDLLRCQRRIIGEVSESSIGEPWRHHAALNGFGDRRCPWPRLRVRHQRHGRNFSRPVTTLAVVLKERENVLIESGRQFFLRRRRSACNQKG